MGREVWKAFTEEKFTKKYPPPGGLIVTALWWFPVGVQIEHGLKDLSLRQEFSTPVYGTSVHNTGGDEGDEYGLLECLHSVVVKMIEASGWIAVSSFLVISYVNNVVVSPMNEAAMCKRSRDAVVLRRM